MPDPGKREADADHSKSFAPVLFRYLLLANYFQYLEAGAVPALLLQLSESFGMNSGQQGLLGGVVYLSLSLGGPFAGYLLRMYDHKTVVMTAIFANIVATFIWAMTPVNQPYSTHMFIAVRFVMGLFQCVVCVFLPLWTNENAPQKTRTSWMSYLQASVPFGIMTGYIIASVLTTLSKDSGTGTCLGLLCWRWPFLIEIALLLPLYINFLFIPREHVTVNIGHSKPRIQSPSQREHRNVVQVRSRDPTTFLKANHGQEEEGMNRALGHEILPHRQVGERMPAIGPLGEPSDSIAAENFASGNARHKKRGNSQFDCDSERTRSASGDTSTVVREEDFSSPRQPDDGSLSIGSTCASTPPRVNHDDCTDVTKTYIHQNSIDSCNKDYQNDPEGLTTVPSPMQDALDSHTSYIVLLGDTESNGSSIKNISNNSNNKRSECSQMGKSMASEIPEGESDKSGSQQTAMQGGIGAIETNGDTSTSSNSSSTGGSSGGEGNNTLFQKAGAELLDSSQQRENSPAERYVKPKTTTGDGVRPQSDHKVIIRRASAPEAQLQRYKYMFGSDGSANIDQVPSYYNSRHFYQDEDEYADADSGQRWSGSPRRHHHHHQQQQDHHRRRRLSAAEKAKRVLLRRHSMSASLVDARSMQNVIKPSYDDLAGMVQDYEDWPSQQLQCASEDEDFDYCSGVSGDDTAGVTVGDRRYDRYGEYSEGYSIEESGAGSGIGTSAGVSADKRDIEVGYIGSRERNGSAGGDGDDEYAAGDEEEEEKRERVGGKDKYERAKCSLLEGENKRKEGDAAGRHGAQFPKNNKKEDVQETSLRFAGRSVVAEDEADFLESGKLERTKARDISERQIGSSQYFEELKGSSFDSPEQETMAASTAAEEGVARTLADSSSAVGSIAGSATGGGWGGGGGSAKSSSSSPTLLKDLSKSSSWSSYFSWATNYTSSPRSTAAAVEEEEEEEASGQWSRGFKSSGFGVRGAAVSSKSGGVAVRQGVNSGLINGVNNDGRSSFSSGSRGSVRGSGGGGALSVQVRKLEEPKYESLKEISAREKRQRQEEEKRKSAIRSTSSSALETQWKKPFPKIKDSKNPNIGNNSNNSTASAENALNNASNSVSNSNSGISTRSSAAPNSGGGGKSPGAAGGEKVMSGYAAQKRATNYISPRYTRGYGAMEATLYRTNAAEIGGEDAVEIMEDEDEDDDPESLFLGGPISRSSPRRNPWITAPAPSSSSAGVQNRSANVWTSSRDLLPILPPPKFTMPGITSALAALRDRFNFASDSDSSTWHGLGAGSSSNARISPEAESLLAIHRFPSYTDSDSDEEFLRPERVHSPSPRTQRRRPSGGGSGAGSGSGVSNTRAPRTSATPLPTDDETNVPVVESSVFHPSSRGSPAILREGSRGAAGGFLAAVSTPFSPGTNPQMGVRFSRSTKQLDGSLGVQSVHNHHYPNQTFYSSNYGHAGDGNGNSCPIHNISETQYLSKGNFNGSGSDHSSRYSASPSSMRIGRFARHSRPGLGGFCSRLYQNLGIVLASMRELFGLSVYRNLIAAMTALYFTVTGVQFWGTKYLRIVLEEPLPLVNTLFVLCAATGPTLGVFFGGWLVDSCGGYKGTKQRVIALEICALFGVTACCFALPITYISSIYYAVMLLWLVLFFGGAILPACSGIIVSVVPRRLRTVSTSLSLVLFNMFGYFLSLIMSGFLMQLIEVSSPDCDTRCSMTWGFRLVLFWSFFSAVFLCLALRASYHTIRERVAKRYYQHLARLRSEAYNRNRSNRF